MSPLLRRLSPLLRRFSRFSTFPSKKTLTNSNHSGSAGDMDETIAQYIARGGVIHIIKPHDSRYAKHITRWHRGGINSNRSNSNRSNTKKFTLLTREQKTELYRRKKRSLAIRKEISIREGFTTKDSAMRIMAVDKTPTCVRAAAPGGGIEPASPNKHWSNP